MGETLVREEFNVEKQICVFLKMISVLETFKTKGPPSRKIE